MKVQRPLKKQTLYSLVTSRNGGSALIAAVSFVFIMGLVVSYVLIASNRQTRNTYRTQMFNTTLAAAGTVIKSMADQAYYLANTRPEQLKNGMAGMDTLMQSITPVEVPGYTAIKNPATNKPLSYYIPIGANDGTYNLINDKEDRWYGFSIRQWKYEGVSFLKPTDPAADRIKFDGAGFRQTVSINHIPLHQFAIFYDGDLEIHPGPVMNIRGPVHSNKTLWVGAQDGITFHSSVSASSNIRRYSDFKLGYNNVASALVNGINPFDNKNHIENSDHRGTVNIKDKNSSNYFTLGDNSSLNSNWATWASDRWNGNVFANAQRINPPLPFITDNNGNPVQATADLIIANAKPTDSREVLDRKIHSMADIIIQTSTANDTEALKNLTLRVPRMEYRNVDGTSTGFDTGNTEMTIPNALFDNKGKVVPNSQIVTQGIFYDGQQQTRVATLDVNIEVLRSRLASINASFFTGRNGVIYVTTTGAPANHMAAVRITNAATLPKSSQNTFTIASDRPVYLAGNFNWNGNANDQGAVTALVAADSVTVMSKPLTLTDTLNGTAPKKGVATKTYTNAILLMGQANSKYFKANSAGKAILKNGQVQTSDYYLDAEQEGRWLRYMQSGGSHNVIRYLENWSNVEHHFNGSLIALFNSKVATGEYDPQKPSYYDAPKRNYSWNTDFLNRVPPIGLPIVIEVAKGSINRVSKQEALTLSSRYK